MFIKKSISAQVKDVDIKEGIVTGYFSVFDNVDKHRDIITKGAYSKTLQENRNVRHLYQHDERLPLAKPHVLKEDAYGLYFESKISQTSYGKDVIQLYADGVIDEHSVAIAVIKSRDKGGVREINEVRLKEGSTVTFAANEMAKLMSMKSATDVMSKIEACQSVLKNGKISDESFLQLEIYLKELQHILSDTQAAQALEPNKDEKLLAQLILIKNKI